MFNKVKSFFGKVISKAENKIETAKAVMTARAHTVLDGTVAEAYVGKAADKPFFARCVRLYFNIFGSEAL